MTKATKAMTMTTGTAAQLRIDEARLLETFLALVRIDGPSGEEDGVAEYLVAALAGAGLPARRDAVGNVPAQVDGRGALADDAPILLCAHMDTVQPGRGVQPRVADGVVRSDGTTILGADDKAGVAAILEAVRALRAPACELPHRPAELLFTVREEVGHFGVRGLTPGSVTARQAVVFDSDAPVGTIVSRSAGSYGVRAAIRGRAAHAGICPEDGISALQVAARAIGAMRLGRIDGETTANIGELRGGVARNVIPAHAELVGEARSHDPAKLAAQLEHMRRCLTDAAEAAGATVDVEITETYPAARVEDGAPLVALLRRAVRACGLTPSIASTG